MKVKILMMLFSRCVKWLLNTKCLLLATYFKVFLKKMQRLQGTIS